MQIIRNLNQIKTSLPPLSLTIGSFDGVHLGHESIINEIKKIAKEKNILSAILTFEPHPDSFFKKDKAKDFRINSLSQKIKILKQQNIDYLIILPFNQSFANITATDFVEKILLKSLNVKNLVVGYDFVFGKNREGNFEFLQKFNLELTKISELKNSDKTCSSSLIRALLKEGNISQANQLLTNRFSIEGNVVEGRKLASNLGFPTANLMTKPHIIKPKFGVYKTVTFIPHLKEKFNSITNFGIKPTVQNSQVALFETHIPNFHQDLYGKKIIVEFVDFIRDEKKFESLDALKKQIAMDVSLVGKWRTV
ncbi:MAG: bifunctional riboflavin kinase/FAD synthetase [Rickettsiales bacterium]|nr:bifunctional riboflavin kinase/FAD synthetase [Rickettsiales bacterium]